VKVLFLTNIPSPYRVDFFNELGKLSQLTVLYEAGYAKDRDIKWKNTTEKYFEEVFLKGIRVGNTSALCFSVIEYLKDKNYDIIVVGGYSTPTGMLSIQYMRMKHIDFILSSDGGIVKDENFIKYKTKKYFISKAAFWLSTGENTSKYLLHYGAKRKMIYTYPFSSVKQEEIINDQILTEEKLKIRKRLNIVEREMVLTVGQFIHRKGFDVLLNAVKDLDEDVAIVFVGGEPTQEYIDVKNKYDLQNVYFLGFKLKEELVEYYKAADLFVLPTREDIWGLVINEALAYGLPVITTDKCVAGLELVEDGLNGYIVPTENDTELAKRMTEILNDENLRIRMGQNSLMKISEYTIENMAKKHFEIFNHIKKCI
jgi:glycosyltransferase involved in cell wall biosynthesis